MNSIIDFLKLIRHYYLLLYILLLISQHIHIITKRTSQNTTNTQASMFIKFEIFHIYTLIDTDVKQTLVRFKYHKY